MTIQLPNDLESRLQAVVQSGRFASIEEAIAEAARLLFLDLERRNVPTPAKNPGDADLGSIGAMRDAAEELDQIVADAYRNRREDTWRDISVE